MDFIGWLHTILAIYVYFSIKNFIERKNDCAVYDIWILKSFKQGHLYRTIASWIKQSFLSITNRRICGPASGPALKFIFSSPLSHNDRILARPFMNRSEVLSNRPINQHPKHGVRKNSAAIPPTLEWTLSSGPYEWLNSGMSRESLLPDFWECVGHKIILIESTRHVALVQTPREVGFLLRS